jgi:predicted nuclease with RNAse H fold
MGGSLPHLLDKIMETISEMYMGIDPTAGRSPYTWAILDECGHLVYLEESDLEEVIGIMEKQKPISVAVNAPGGLNKGLVRTRLAEENQTRNPRGVDLRMCEYELRERGINVPPTPSRYEVCPTWIQMGINLTVQLEERGYKKFNKKGTDPQLLEVNTHAIFCALLKQVPLPKPSLEGRIQRQLVLHEHGEDIIDPMDFFEEITRHRILRGSLPMDYVYASHELDALAAAFVAWFVKLSPEEITSVGDQEEGEIILPVKKLEENYNLSV